MIELIKPNEIDSVMKIWLETNLKAHNFIEGDYWRENYRLVMEEYIPFSETYVYKTDGILKGFISVLDNTYVGSLFIEEEYQNQGIGTKLLNYCKKVYPYLELKVYVKNKCAVNFYKKNGFIVKNIQNNNGDHDKEYIMTWNKEVK